MSRPMDMLTVYLPDAADRSPINHETVFSRTAPCSAIDTMAAWTTHVAGVAIVLTVIGGLSGYMREWVAPATLLG